MQCAVKSSLKVVGNEKGGGSGGWLLFEDAFGPWRSMSVYFLMLPSSFPQRTVFPFPVCNAQLIGDWYENRRGAPSTIILLIIRQYIGAPMHTCANRSGGPNTKKFYWRTVPGHHCLLAEGDIGAPIYWRTDDPRAITIGGPMVSHLLGLVRTK